MAATSELARRIELDLRAVGADVDFLPELERDWDGETEVNRRIWHQEWWDDMGRLRGLHAAYLQGLMSTEQTEHFRALVERLRSRLPIVKRLGLVLPPVPLQLDT